MPLPWPTFPILGSRLVSEFRGDYNDITTDMISAFAGVEEPTPKYAGMFWVDTSTTPKLLKQRNSLNTAWVVRARVDQDWGGLLPLVGGTMEGVIDMGGFGITNLPAGSGNAPARYADLAPYAKLDGSIPFTGIPSGPATDPSLANQFARKAYVDAKAIAGGTFTGKITMPFAPVAGSNELVRAVDVDNVIGTHNHSGGVGQGVKIPVTSISPSGGSASNGPRHDGTNVVWAPNGVIADDWLLTLFDTTTDIGITTVDLSAYIPATSRVAILEVTFINDNGFHFTFDLRRTGATSFHSFVGYADISITGGEETFPWTYELFHKSTIQVLAQLDVLRRMDYRVTRSLGIFGGSGSPPNTRCTARLAGYL